MSIDRREFIKGLACGAAAVAAGAPGAALRSAWAQGSTSAPRRKPNLILIFSDDQGYGDVGCYGSSEILTPHTDSLARDGVRFTDGYVSAPVCSPSRAGLLTGRYQQRFGHESNAQATPGLNLQERTIADVLGEAGYATGLIGKWHLGSGKPYVPTARGFKEFFGYLQGELPHYGGEAVGVDKSGQLVATPAEIDVVRGTETVREAEYLTDALGREAVSFIDRHKHEPFFLYLAHKAPHKPIEAPRAYVNRFKQIADPRRRVCAASIACLDDNIGKVLAKLRQEKLERDTFIVFLSDNGGIKSKNASLNGPLRGEKFTLWEGGIRVPFIMSWPGVLPAGETYSHPVISLDVLPTFAGAAGAAAPAALDGVDLREYLVGQRQTAPHELLFWRTGNPRAVRKGQWKLLIENAGRPGALFDLSADIGESRDLSASKAQLAEELRSALADWNDQLPAPKNVGKV